MPLYEFSNGFSGICYRSTTPTDTEQKNRKQIIILVSRELLSQNTSNVS